MRFGPDIHVFPGGRIDPGDADAADAAIRETLEETGIALDRDALVPMTRWVTPPGLPYRFDVRFFAAFVAAGTAVGATSDEVVDAEWMTPADALEAMAEARITIWLPTVVTLQQLAGLSDREDVERTFAPGEAASTTPRIAAVSELEAAVQQPWAGGIEGRTAPARLVGRREVVVVDPADPTGVTADAILAWAAERQVEVVGVAVTDLDPLHHAGVEMFAAGHGLPVAAGPGTSRRVPYPVTELRNGEAVPFGDVGLIARADPTPVRPERTRFEVGRSP